MLVQRYIRHVTDVALEKLEPIDDKIEAKLVAFDLTATDADRAAFGNRNTKNKKVASLHKQIEKLLAEQEAILIAYLRDEAKDFANSEATFITETTQGEQPKGVTKSEIDNVVVAGLTFLLLLKLMFKTLTTKTIARLTINSNNLARAFKGSAAQKFKDRIKFWKNKRNIEPTINQTINAAGNYGALKSMKYNRVEWFDWVSKLDGGVCKTCSAYDARSPYRLDTLPKFPVHPNDRCVIVPAQGKKKYPDVSFKDWYSKQTSKFRRLWGQKTMSIYNDNTKTKYSIDQLDKKTREI